MGSRGVFRAHLGTLRVSTLSRQQGRGNFCNAAFQKETLQSTKVRGHLFILEFLPATTAAFPQDSRYATVAFLIK